MSEIQKKEVLVATDSLGLRELILAQARLFKVSRKDLVDKSHGFTVEGPGLMLRTNDSVLEVSRRDGGLAHLLAFYEVSNYKVGIIFILADDTLLAVCFDPADGETRNWIAAASGLKALQLVLTGEQAVWRLMRIPAENILHALRNSTSGTQTTGATDFFSAATSVIRLLIAGKMGEQLGIDIQAYKRLEAHYLMPEVKEEAEPQMDLLREATLH